MKNKECVNFIDVYGRKAEIVHTTYNDYELRLLRDGRTIYMSLHETYQQALDKLKIFDETFKEEKEILPTEVELSIYDVLDESTIDELVDNISDTLSDKYGYCHGGFKYDISIKASDIKWDIDEEDENDENETEE